MSDRIIVQNGPDVLVLEEVVIGSQLPIAVYVERETGFQTGIFEPFDFTGMTIECNVRADPRDDLPVAEFTCTPRIEDGWVDLLLDGEQTLELLDHKYEASLKVWPAGEPEHGDTLMIIVLPMKYRGTR